MEIDLGDRIIKITAKARKIDSFKEPRQFMEFNKVTGYARFIKNDFIQEDNSKLHESVLLYPDVYYDITEKIK